MELRWSRVAQADIDAIISYYAAEDAALPAILVERILHAPLALLDFPFLGPEIEIGVVRKWRVDDSPFLLLYTVDRAAVTILRVRHERDDWAKS